jgi:hypothetical protein
MLPKKIPQYTPETKKALNAILEREGLGKVLEALADFYEETELSALECDDERSARIFALTAGALLILAIGAYRVEQPYPPI